MRATVEIVTTPGSGEGRAAATGRRIRRALTRRGYDAAIRTFADFAALPGWRARLRRLRQLAFPPPAFVLQQFGARTRLALPWLYAWRGARGIARLFRRVA